MGEEAELLRMMNKIMRAEIDQIYWIPNDFERSDCRIIFKQPEGLPILIGHLVMLNVDRILRIIAAYGLTLIVHQIADLPYRDTEAKVITYTSEDVSANMYPRICGIAKYIGIRLDKVAFTGNQLRRFQELRELSPELSNVSVDWPSDQV
ncbi:hypothetical protein TWF694_007700 [Orbilia ellipsospora]|uniref:Uncharacterized protein n=1 Tax=Orbilia ellipsospora TaxID=2528407 RepID=A0AAV9XIG9_9PEZI